MESINTEITEEEYVIFYLRASLYIPYISICIFYININNSVTCSQAHGYFSTPLQGQYLTQGHYTIASQILRCV